MTAHYSVPTRLIVGWMVVGLVVLILVLKVTHHPAVPAIVWLVIGLDALRLTFLSVRRAGRQQVLFYGEDSPESVWAVATVRRERIRGLSQGLFVVAGLVSLLTRYLLDAAWLRAVPVDALVYAQFLMWMNGHFDSTLSDRVRLARAASQRRRGGDRVQAVTGLVRNVVTGNKTRAVAKLVEAKWLHEDQARAVVDVVVEALFPDEEEGR